MLRFNPAVPASSLTQNLPCIANEWNICNFVSSRDIKLSIYGLTAFLRLGTHLHGPNLLSQQELNNCISIVHQRHRKLRVSIRTS